MRYPLLHILPFLALTTSGQFTTDHDLGGWSPQPQEQPDIRTFDPDRDGDQDIFFNRPASGSGSLVWYENLGGGDFAPPVTIATGCCDDPAYPTDFDVHDVDGDGDQDVAYVRNGSNAILVKRFDAGAFGTEETWAVQASTPRYLRFVDLPSIQWYWLVTHGTSGQPIPYYSTGNAFSAYAFNGQPVNLSNVTNIEAGHISGYAGDIVVQTIDRLWLYIIQNGGGDNHVMYPYDIGYCDDRIQIVEIDGYAGEEIGRTNNDTCTFTQVYFDFDLGIVDYTYIATYSSGGNGGYGTYGRLNCDPYTDLFAHYTGGDNGAEPVVHHGEYPDGFDFGPTVAVTGPGTEGSYPVLTDLNGDGLNDLIQVVGGNSLHWYTNGGQAPAPVSFDPLPEPLVNCQNYYYLEDGLPADGYFTGPIVVPTFEFGEYVDRWGQPAGAYPVTYNATDNNGCLGTALRYLYLIDSVNTIPASLDMCTSGTPVQLASDPAGAVWLSDNYVTSDGLLDVSYPFETDLTCYWSDATQCGAYGSMHVNITQGETGEAYITNWQRPDTLCVNDDPVQIHRTVGDGTFELIPFDPAVAGEGYFTFIGYADTGIPADCYQNDTLRIHVLPAPVVSLAPFTDTLATDCLTGYPLTGGLPADDYNYWGGDGVYAGDFGWYLQTEGLVGDIPITFTHYDLVTGCSNSATQPITVIDSVVVVPDPLIICPQPDSVQVLTYPNAVWGSNEIPGGLVDVSYPYQQHYLCYWTDVSGCGVYGQLDVNVRSLNYGSTYIDCYCTVLCTNDDPVSIERTLPDGTYDHIEFDPATAGVGQYFWIGYADTTGGGCAVNDTIFLEVQGPPTVTLDPFTDTLSNQCSEMYYLLTGGSPTAGDNYFYSGQGVVNFDQQYFDASGLLGQYPVTFTWFDPITGCHNDATRTITVIDSVVVVPDPLITCPQPDSVQVLTYPNAVWGSNEIPGGLVDVSYPYQQHYLCYWTDAAGCGAYGELDVNVLAPAYGYAYTDCYCATVCTNGDPVTITRSLPDGTEEEIVFDPTTAAPGIYSWVGYGDATAACPLNDTLYITVADPPVVTLEPFLDTLANTCFSGFPLHGGAPEDGSNGWSGDGVYFFESAWYFDAMGLLGGIPVTYTHTDALTGCSSSATQPITVLDSVVVVPDSIVTCPVPDPLQVYTYPNAVWGSNEVPNGLVDLSYPHQQHYLCYWTDVMGCGVYGALAVNVVFPDLGYVSTSCECTALCVNDDPITVTTSQSDGSDLATPFDPAIAGPGTYMFVGYGFTGNEPSCPVNDTLYLTVHALPTVDLAPFTDTLVAGCSGGYPLTGGSPAGGYYDGPGVNGDLFPFALSGQVPITYYYTDGNGCTSSTTREITVIDQLAAAPPTVNTCPDPDAIQLSSFPPGAVWGGSIHVTPQGSLDVSTPNNEAVIGTWTDVIGCAVDITVPVTVNQLTYGAVQVSGYNEPVSLCVNTPAVDVLASQPDGSTLPVSFDPSQGAGTYAFIGYGPEAAECPVDVTLTITVNAIPNVTLAPFTDTLVAGCSGSYVLTGGSPAGGYFDGPGVDGEFYPFAQSGAVPITYQYTDGNGCTAYATRDITVIDQLLAAPDAVTSCIGTDPVQLTSVPPGAVWGGSSYVTSSGSLDVSTPNTETAIGTWTDVIGCAVEVDVPVTVYDHTYGTAEAFGYTEPVLVCTNNGAITVATSQADGTTLNVPFDPAIAGPGVYTFIGYGPNAAVCPMNDTLTITVNEAPTVTLAAFTDTLVNACTGPYALTGGSPSGGVYSGDGVSGDFFPQGLSGQVDITYTYTDGNGCANSATGAITVIDALSASVAAVTSCPDTDPVQLSTTPPGAVWSGSNNVTPGGQLDVSSPFTADIIGTWTDVTGCALDVTVPVTVNAYTYGTAEVPGYSEPVSLCVNTPPVTVETSQPDGSVLMGIFDPSTGANTYEFTGYAPITASCPVDVTLTITVNSVPTVTLAAFNDTLVNACAGPYALTGGLPAGGVYSGDGVSGDFFPQGLSGQVQITYTYTDGNGCANSATGAITVIDALNASVASVTSCPDTDPVQLTTTPPGAVWSGSTNVTPGGLLDVSSPFTADIIGTWTDVTGCALDVTVPVTVNAIDSGYAYVLDIPEPVVLCDNHAPVNVVTSSVSGTEDSFSFDPATQGVGQYVFTGYAPGNAPCPIDVTLTIEVTGAPAVSLALPYDELCTGTTVALSGGLPLGGTFVDYNGTGGQMDIAEGINAVTYTYTDGNGCSGSATDQALGISVTEANGYDAGTPVLCPNDAPLVFEPAPANGDWSGAMDDDTFDPTVEPDGTWAYTITDDAGNSCAIGGNITVLPYTPATLATSATTVCVTNGAVVISGTNALGGTITGPITLDDPLDPFNPAGTFDPSVGPGNYDFSMDVAGDDQGCAWTAELTITVVAEPNVTVSTFTDTLLNICSTSVYTLTQGSPSGGTWSGPGVADNTFSPFGLTGPQTLTYSFSAGPGCEGTATGVIEVMPEVISTPYDSQTPLYACEDADPVQLTTTPSGADWTGAAVTPQGFVDMAEPFNGLLTYLYTDAAGCAYGDELQAVISPYSMGYVTIDAPGATQVCANGEAFTVHMSTLDGEDSTYTFDPMVLGPGIHPFEGVAPLQTDPPGCYQDAVITIQVVDTTHLVLDDNWALDTEGGFTLDGGAPAGGTYSGPGVTNGVFNPAEGNIGANIITYSINSGLCPGSATDTLWVSTVGLVENHAEERLELWPVPARDELFIHVPAGLDDALLTIVDAGGREVARRAVPGRVNGTPVRWDVGALANGSYTLWMTGQGHSAPARFVVAH